MASSDITVSGLSKIGNENAEYLVSKIRTIPGFPKEGILFRDFMPVLAFWSCVGSAPGQGLHRSAQGWQASSGNR